MSTCRACRWYRVDIGNPMKGVCIVNAYQVDSKDATSGSAGSVIPGKLIQGSDEACDKFEDKKSVSRAQRLNEGM